MFTICHISTVICCGINAAWRLYNIDLYRHKDDINVNCDLLAVKHGDVRAVRFV